MITAIIVLACVGLFLTLLGRWLMVREVKELPLRWKLALGVLPLGDLICLAGPWPSAKGGAMTSLVGMALLLPLSGQALLDASHPSARRKGELAMLFTQGRAAAQAAEARGLKERLIANKDLKVKELSWRLQDWHDSLTSRRAAFEKGTEVESDKVAADSTEIGGEIKIEEVEGLEAFNAEAAAYHALLAVAKEDLAKLEALRSAAGK